MRFDVAKLFGDQTSIATIRSGTLFLGRLVPRLAGPGQPHVAEVLIDDTWTPVELAEGEETRDLREHLLRPESYYGSGRLFEHNAHVWFRFVLEGQAVDVIASRDGGFVQCGAQVALVKSDGLLGAIQRMATRVTADQR